jgi:hypothetical protein
MAGYLLLLDGDHAAFGKDRLICRKSFLTTENDSSEILTQGLIFAENYPAAFAAASLCSAGPITRSARFTSSSACVS